MFKFLNNTFHSRPWNSLTNLTHIMYLLTLYELLMRSFTWVLSISLFGPFQNTRAFFNWRQEIEYLYTRHHFNTLFSILKQTWIHGFKRAKNVLPRKEVRIKTILNLKPYLINKKLEVMVNSHAAPLPLHTHWATNTESTSENIIHILICVIFKEIYF